MYNCTRTLHLSLQNAPFFVQNQQVTDEIKNRHTEFRDNIQQQQKNDNDDDTKNTS